MLRDAVTTALLGLALENISYPKSRQDTHFQASVKGWQEVSFSSLPNTYI